MSALDPAIEAAVVGFLRGGTDPRQAARLAGCSMSTAYRIRRRYLEPGVDTPTRNERIAKLTRRGWSARAIAAEVGCTERTVVRIRKKTGVAKPAARRLTDADRALAERLFADGCSVSEVERTLGRSQGSLCHAFPGRGWTRQQTGEFAAAAKRAKKLARGAA